MENMDRSETVKKNKKDNDPEKVRGTAVGNAFECGSCGINIDEFSSRPRRRSRRKERRRR